jgi:hypothetical protein
MLHSVCLRRLMFSVLTCLALAGVGITLPLTMARPAHAQVAADFREALAPYGEWIRHPRWGMVWVADDTPPDWQPYRYGHWIYTEDWGWYWISDPEEEDWGWIVFHYGRWIHDRGAWFWVPGDEWAPAWVDWRYGGDYVGWAPLPPNALIDAYDDDPAYWVFVSPRFLVAPRLHAYIFSPSRRRDAFRHTHVVNRTLGYGRGRAAVNAGLPPSFIARAHRGPLPTYRVNPRVLSRTQGVAGAVRVAPDQLRAAPRGQGGRRPSANRANAVAVQPTNNTVAPAGATSVPQPLGRGERGRVGSHPPRAAHGGPPAPQQQPQIRPQQLQQQLQQQQQKQQQIRTQPPRQPPSIKREQPAPQLKSAPPAQVQPAPRATPQRQAPPPTVRHAPPQSGPRPPPAAAPPPAVKRAAPPQPPPQAVRRAPPPQAAKPAPKPPAGKPAPQQPEAGANATKKPY